MKKILFGFLLLLLFPASAFAHTGGGPPFFEVNGRYAQTNPYYVGTSSINLPQDYAPDTYLVNKPLQFRVDTNKLLVPPEIATQTVFRWSMSEGSREYKYGTDLTYTYTKPKTYLITVEAQAPGQNGFIVIDTVQVNVLPYNGYQLPKVAMTVETTNRISTKPILFKSSVGTDSSTGVDTLIWDFGDGSVSHDANALHTFPDFTSYNAYFVILRVIDKNQFVSDTGIAVESVNSKLTFTDKAGKKNSIPIADTISKADVQASTTQKSQLPPYVYILGGFFGLVFLTVVIQFLMRKK